MIPVQRVFSGTFPILCRKHGIVRPKLVTGPACLMCALDGVTTTDDFRRVCRSTGENGPHQVPAWNEWAALANDGEVVSSPDRTWVERELAKRNELHGYGLKKLAWAGHNVRA